jgi:hypothetical protein
MPGGDHFEASASTRSMKTTSSSLLLYVSIWLPASLLLGMGKVSPCKKRCATRSYSAYCCLREMHCKLARARTAKRNAQHGDKYGYAGNS